jgi:spore coat protein CotH
MKQPNRIHLSARLAVVMLVWGAVMHSRADTNLVPQIAGLPPGVGDHTNFDQNLFPPGGPGGMSEKTELVQRFDADGDGWLNAEERKAALASIGNRDARGPGGFPGGPGARETVSAPQPGPKLSPADVKTYPDVPLYDALTVRTFFLEFEDADWEKELTAFHRTDVEVPAVLTVDGKTYRDVGVHFHGMSSFMMVGEGRKHSLMLTLDFVHPDQALAGGRKFLLLNSHEDPSFLHTVLAMQIARDYLPAPQANFVRVVINGECRGIYVSQQTFNKEFVRQWFGTAKGARWKVSGSPDGEGGMNYPGEDAAAYKRIYTLKSRDNPLVWADLIKLCKVLNETPVDQLESALASCLDVDGALRFFAWENALASSDGFYTRASDYDLYEDKTGQFHIIPYDANETFSPGGGPGGPDGPGGPGGTNGSSRVEFGPGMFLAPPMFTQADKDGDRKLTRAEFMALADAWFDKLVTNQTMRVDQEQFAAKITEILPMPGPRGGRGQSPPGRPGMGGPPHSPAQGLFNALDANHDGVLTRDELEEIFGKWFDQWASGPAGLLTVEQLRTGLNTALPRPDFGGPNGRPGGPGGGGVELDPLVSVNDTNKPLISRLLAVPVWRTRYLGYVRDLAEKWLDWDRLGPMAEQYHALIAADVQADTRKLYSFEAFQDSITNGASKTEAAGDRTVSLKDFAEKRRAFLLNHAALKPAEPGPDSMQRQH